MPERSVAGRLRLLPGSLRTKGVRTHDCGWQSTRRVNRALPGGLPEACRLPVELVVEFVGVSVAVRACVEVKR
jgi:hypothetical protein